MQKTNVGDALDTRILHTVLSLFALDGYEQLTIYFGIHILMAPGGKHLLANSLQDTAPG